MGLRIHLAWGIEPGDGSLLYASHVNLGAFYATPINELLDRLQADGRCTAYVYMFDGNTKFEIDPTGRAVVRATVGAVCGALRTTAGHREKDSPEDARYLWSVVTLIERAEQQLGRRQIGCRMWQD